MKSLSFAATVVAALLSMAVPAAETAPENAIVVTATRTAQTVDETLAAVTVITRDDIERSQVQSVAELLTGLAGMDANISGGFGKTTGFFVRGTNSDHILVLVDGVRIGSATMGTVAWEHLPVSQIERIEIVRGPRSSLYGADAIGGVVQIFTRHGQGDPHADVRAGYGTYNSREYSANVSGASSSAHFSAAANRFETDGINAKKESVAHEPDADGYRNNSFSSRVGYRFDGGAAIDARLLHAQGRNEYDGSWDNESRFIQNSVGIETRFAPLDIWSVKLQLARSRDESDHYLNGVYAYTYNTGRVSQSWQNDLVFARRQLLTLGVDRQRDAIESSSEYSQTLRQNTGYFAQHQAGFGPHDLIAAIRRDDNETYGVHHTGNLGWGYAVAGERLRLTASHGTAFKAPNFNALYWPYSNDTYFGTTYVTHGNTDLQPEESRSTELGARYHVSEQTRLQVNVFQNRVRNLIDWVTSQTDATTYTTVPQNVNNALIRGAELQLEATPGTWNTRLGLTWLDPRDADTGNLLRRRARRSFRLDADRTFGAWHMGGEWVIQSYRFEDTENTQRLGGYALVGLRAQYDFAHHWFVRARANNVFDKEYETAADYNSPGRHFFMSIGYQVH